MSADENKKLLHAIYAGLEVGEGGLFVKSLAENVRFRITGQHAWSGIFDGKAALINIYGTLLNRLSGRAKAKPLHFFADGDHVIVEARGDMLTKAGEPYNSEYCFIYRLENGKIVDIREYGDSALTERVLGPLRHS